LKQERLKYLQKIDLFDRKNSILSNEKWLVFDENFKWSWISNFSLFIEGDFTYKRIVKTGALYDRIHTLNKELIDLKNKRYAIEFSRKVKNLLNSMHEGKQYLPNYILEWDAEEEMLKHPKFYQLFLSQSKTIPKVLETMYRLGWLDIEGNFTQSYFFLGAMGDALLEDIANKTERKYLTTSKKTNYWKILHERFKGEVKSSISPSKGSEGNYDDPKENFIQKFLEID